MLAIYIPAVLEWDNHDGVQSIVWAFPESYTCTMTVTLAMAANWKKKVFIVPPSKCVSVYAWVNAQQRSQWLPCSQNFHTLLLNGQAFSEHHFYYQDVLCWRTCSKDVSIHEQHAVPHGESKIWGMILEDEFAPPVSWIRVQLPHFQKFFEQTNSCRMFSLATIEQSVQCATGWAWL